MPLRAIVVLVMMIQLVRTRLAGAGAAGDPKHQKLQSQFQSSCVGLNDGMQSLTQGQHLFHAGVLKRRVRPLELRHLRLNAYKSRRCNVLRELEPQAQLKQAS